CPSPRPSPRSAGRGSAPTTPLSPPPQRWHPRAGGVPGDGSRGPPRPLPRLPAGAGGGPAPNRPPARSPPPAPPRPRLACDRAPPNPPAEVGFIRLRPLKGDRTRVNPSSLASGGGSILSPRYSYRFDRRRG